MFQENTNYKNQQTNKTKQIKNSNISTSENKI